MAELIGPSRRGFLFGAVTAAVLLAAPAIVQAANLMHVRQLPLLTDAEQVERFMQIYTDRLFAKYGTVHVPRMTTAAGRIRRLA